MNKNIFVACDISSQKEVIDILEKIQDDNYGIKIGLQYITGRSPDEIRELSKELGITTAALAHHYSLSMSDASTIVLGVKNRKELRECIEVEKLGKMQPSMIKRLDDIISNLNI